MPPSPPPLAPECAEQQYDGWNRVLASVPCSGVRRLSERRMRLEVPASAAYDIDASETISVTLRAGALTSHQPTTAAITFSVAPTAGSARLSGTLLSMDESGMRAGGGTLTISVEGDSWKPALGEELRMEILSGLASMQLEAHGWTNEVRGALRPEHLELLGPEAVRITLPPSAAYNLVLAETVAVQIPAAALISGRPLDAETRIELAAVTGRAVFSGYTEYDSTEAALRWGTASRWSEEANALLTEPLTLTVTLLEEEWAPEVGSDSAVSAALLASLTSAQAEPAGWNAVVQPTIGLELRDVTTARYSLPAAPEYSIREPETLLLSAVRTALESARKVAAPLELVLMPAGGSALLTDAGSLYLLDDKDEAQVRDKGLLRLKIELSGDAWARDVAVPSQSSADLIRSFTSLQSSPRGWNTVVRELLSSADLERVDDTTLILSVPQTAEYDITLPETIVAEIAGGALLSGVNAPLTAAAPAGQLVIHALPGSAALDGSLLGAA